MLCDDLEESLRFYRDTLSLQVVARFYQEGRVDTALLSDRSPTPGFLIALHGRPFGGSSEQDYKANGAHLSSLGFVTGEIEGWTERLIHTPLEHEEFPSEFPNARVLSLHDPAGVRVNLLNFADPRMIPRATSLSRSEGGKTHFGIDYWLASISIDCRNTAEVVTEKQFYT